MSGEYAVAMLDLERIRSHRTILPISHHTRNLFSVSHSSSLLWVRVEVVLKRTCYYTLNNLTQSSSINEWNVIINNRKCSESFFIVGYQDWKSIDWLFDRFDMSFVANLKISIFIRLRSFSFFFSTTNRFIQNMWMLFGLRECSAISDDDNSYWMYYPATHVGQWSHTSHFWREKLSQRLDFTFVGARCGWCNMEYEYEKKRIHCSSSKEK